MRLLDFPKIGKKLKDISNEMTFRPTREYSRLLLENPPTSWSYNPHHIRSANDSQCNIIAMTLLLRSAERFDHHI